MTHTHTRLECSRSWALLLLLDLALRQAEGEKMFSKRLSLVMADDTSLPTYQAQKELWLARVRYRKADLLERCQVRLRV